MHTSQLLITAGQNIDRLRGEGSFARICAAAPIPASSGRTSRYRLDRGGDRRANKTLHMILVTRRRAHAPTVAYINRRVQEGKSRREATRCLSMKAGRGSRVMLGG